MYSVESWRETYSVGESWREMYSVKERECVFQKDILRRIFEEDVLRRESWRETYSVGERESFEENVTPSTAANQS
jgi:hypothetical protein